MLAAVKHSLCLLRGGLGSRVWGLGFRGLGFRGLGFRDFGVYRGQGGQSFEISGLGL